MQENRKRVGTVTTSICRPRPLFVVHTAFHQTFLPTSRQLNVTSRLGLGHLRLHSPVLFCIRKRKICADEIYCVEWAGDHFGLSLT